MNKKTPVRVIPLFSTALCRKYRHPTNGSFLFLFILLYLIDRASDVMAHVLICKINPLCRLVCFCARLLQILSSRRNAEHTPAVRDDRAVLIELRSRMEAEIIVLSVELFKPVIGNPFS